MPRMYLRPLNDATRYSDLQAHPTEPWQRTGFEWVLGEPPHGAQIYQELTTLEKMDAIFMAQPVEVRAQFLREKAAIKDAFETDKSAVRLLVESLKVPLELEPVKAALLELFPING